MDDLISMTPTETLEVLTKVCPYPLILTKKSMETLPSGAVLKIISDCVSAENVISGYCEKQGFEFQTVKLKEHWEFYIRKS